ncbi:9140_t:CDS:2, partial [Racocetra fulgida]
MSPDQIERWSKYSNVVLNDNTSITNHYEMVLLLFLVVDNYLSSRLVAQALTDNETKDTHSWILQQIKQAIHRAIPQIIFTDADPALIAAIGNKFSTTNALYYMFHIAQNIPLNLKSHLKDNFDDFIKDFLEVQRISFVTIFEYCNESVVNYLQQLYANKKLWAKAFVLKLFIAGISSMSQVKSYNAKVKRLIFNSNTTLLELVEKLTIYVLEEDKKTEYALFHVLVPKAALVAAADKLSSNNDSDVGLNSNSNSKSEDNTSKIRKKKFDPKVLMNLHKGKSKGQLKETDRIRHANESSKKAKCKLH